MFKTVIERHVQPENTADEIHIHIVKMVETLTEAHEEAIKYEATVVNPGFITIYDSNGTEIYEARLNKDKWMN